MFTDIYINIEFNLYMIIGVCVCLHIVNIPIYAVKHIALSSG